MKVPFLAEMFKNGSYFVLFDQKMHLPHTSRIYPVWNVACLLPDPETSLLKVWERWTWENVLVISVKTQGKLREHMHMHIHSSCVNLVSFIFSWKIRLISIKWKKVALTAKKKLASLSRLFRPRSFGTSD